MRLVRIKTKIKINQSAKTSSIFSYILMPLVLGIFLFSYVGSGLAAEYNLNDSYSKEIWQLNQEINEKRKAIDQLNKQTEIYKKTLAQKQQKITSLSTQLGQINASIAQTSLEVESLGLQLDELNLKISSTQLKIQSKEQEIKTRQDNIAKIVRALEMSNKQDALLAVLSDDGSLGDYFEKVRSLEQLEETVFNNLKEVQALHIALVSDKSALEDDKKTVEDTRTDLDAKKDTLESQKYVKNLLLDQTKGEEQKYKVLLEKSKKEVQAINSDIVNLEQVAREKLNRQVQKGDLGSTQDFMWPVPSHYITAYFHDPDYPFRNVFEHPAVDIRAAQGTAIKAAKSGYVARAKNAGMGYSYIMLVHDNDLSTVYGHVSKIIVSEDTYVTQGQIIGYSGGTPGTPGAGNLTTAPHLHFEVRLNGIPVNPLNYLP